MIKQFFLNALNSWATSALGLVLGGPEIYAGLQGVLDTDPATTVDWKVLAVGVGILFMGMITRDWTKGLFKSERNPEIK